MKIQGEVEIEGIKLQVNIEAPDDAQNLYVTNVSPTCVVVPRERWQIEWLGLSEKTVRELTKRGLTTIAHLIDDQWQLKIGILPETISEEIKEALERLRSIAIVFKGPVISEEETAPSSVAARRKNLATAAKDLRELVGEIEAIGAGQDKSLTQLGLPNKVIRMLTKRYSVGTAKELAQLGEPRIIMTPGLTAQDISLIKAKLAEIGLYLIKPAAA